ncbi:purine nucleoside permease [Polychaeton citri CBS 116435]|uniref:Purine nucleoside permease n=1 Tax=Polychaeton citri CBS 116435 TaxID=1314669 RepID=A0A9P4Q519_9PEZI|nr:purine nucleoside permease [Polychaeton citri CBS 116435]
MLLSVIFSTLLVAVNGANIPHPHSSSPAPWHGQHPVAPKVMIITGFTPERDIYEPLNLTVQYPMPGFLPQYKNISCSVDHDICLLTMGQAEIGNGIAMTLLFLSDLFDLTKTYFLVAGISGISPRYSTIGSVVLPKYVVEVELGQAFAGTDLPANFTDNYFFGFGSEMPNIYPSVSGTEVYELNEALRDRAASVVESANIEWSNDDQSSSYRALYSFSKARAPPGLDKCDVASAMVYWSGEVYARNVEYYVDLISNGTAKYCSTNEDDTGTLAGLLRGAMLGKVDFSRIIIAKGSSDFDRPPPGVTAYQNLFEINQNGFAICLENLYKVSKVFIDDLLANWDDVYAGGIKTDNYVGDICGLLGGTPDFGPGHC